MWSKPWNIKKIHLYVYSGITKVLKVLFIKTVCKAQVKQRPKIKVIRI